MAKPLFTPEELAELEAIDRELDETFRQTPEEIAESRRRDRRAVLDSMSPDARKIAEAKKAYYEANRDKIAEAKKAYREANRDKIAGAQKAYREANRDKYNKYMRLYLAKRRAALRTL